MLLSTGAACSFTQCSKVVSQTVPRVGGTVVSPPLPEEILSQSTRLLDV